ncbi:alpha/beta hydrolase [Miniphocaeibacter halophilus]|uniref:Lysophospholipase n=1 Tax=Miniphocaeibacter halophilus TaxID=2931922 RepID=A0AC61N4Q8_9FIRM|nr:alpha/beta hydrolase [Miniphocaeibacter halophilus]QQK07988.1 lysophospholipase [Miniphocaeibacter halophilus]
MYEEKLVPSFDGTELRMRSDKVDNPKAVVLICHGLCEHLNRYDYVTEKLNENNFSVYRYDQRGHGKSKGKDVYFNDYKDMPSDANFFFKIAEQENPGIPIFVLGHSMGGETATLFGTIYPRKAKGIILSGALTRFNTKLFPDKLMDADDEFYFKNALGDGVCSDQNVVQKYIADPLVKNMISAKLVKEVISGVHYLKKNADKFIAPVLILHGADDGLVSEKDSRDLFGEIASKDKGLIIYPKLFHEILNEPVKDKIIAEIVEWINERI